MNVFERTAKINEGLAPLAAVCGALAWTQPAVAGSDLWWHLASGRSVWAAKSLPGEDVFSFTFQGREWLNHEWLWDVGVWAVYAWEPQAVAWANLGVLLATFALLYAGALRVSGSRLGAVAATWIVAAGSHWFFDIRPHVVTLLLVALLLLIRERPWAPLLWPAIVLLWANLHAGFVFGVCAIGLDVVLRTALGSWRARRLVLPRREWLGLALCGVALLANPWGLRILEYPLGYLDRDSGFRSLREWLPVAFSLDPRGFEGRFWWTAFLAAGGVAPALRQRPYLVALAAVTFAMAWTSRRFIPLFDVTAVSLVALSLRGLVSRAQVHVPALGTQGAAVAASLFALVVALGLHGGVRFTPGLLERWTQADFYPSAAVRYLEALGPPERVLNLYIWGGFLMLHLPESQVFIDGRANTLYDEAILADYVAISNGRPGSTARLARYDPDVALVDTGGAFSAALRAGPEPWRRIYSDAIAEILVPPDSTLLSQRLPAPASVVGDMAQFRIRVARRLALRGQPRRATRLLAEVIADDPLNSAAHGELAYAYAVLGDPAGVERALAAGLDAIPRRRDTLFEYGAQAWERAGYLSRAIDAYQRTLPAGPFHPGAERQAQIDRLKRRLAAPAADRQAEGRAR